AQSAGNALDPSNDTLNGAAALPGASGNVVLTRVSGDAELALDTETGAITLAAGAAAGTYTVTYRICERTNGDNCAEATETVTVTDTALAAGPEPVRALIGTDAAQSAGNALDPSNDTLNGAAAVPGAGGTVVLTRVSGDAELALDTETGAITLAAGAPEGTYTVTYRICEAANTDHCAEATETVTVTFTPIAAGPEPVRSFTATIDPIVAGNALDPSNDTLDGFAAVPGFGGNVVLTLGGGSPEVSLNVATGELGVAAGTPPGTYVLDYN
ncbi:hypothetical protein, partial [Pseudaestuariivita atlantica]